MPQALLGEGERSQKLLSFMGVVVFPNQTSVIILPVLLEPKAADTAVLPDGFSSLGTSFCMSAWPNSHPGGRLLDTVKRYYRITAGHKVKIIEIKKKNLPVGRAQGQKHSAFPYQ